MLRVKRITRFSEWDQDFMEELNQKQYVVAEYDYSNTKNVYTGDLLEVTFSGACGKKKFVAICSNYWRTVKRMGCGRCNYYKYRILYRLTEEGFRLVQSKILEERI